LEDDDSSPVLITAVSRIASIISTPTPGIPNSSPPLALGYPLALVAVALLTTWQTAAVVTVLFGALSWLGRTLVLDDYYYELGDEDDDEDDEEERPPSPLLLDFVSLVLSVVSASVLVPSSTAGGGIDFGLLLGIPVALLAVGQVFFALEDTQEEKTTPQERLLDVWDRQFRRERKGKRKDID
jgi:hypothetical protein